MLVTLVRNQEKGGGRGGGEVWGSVTDYSLTGEAGFTATCFFLFVFFFYDVKQYTRRLEAGRAITILDVVRDPTNALYSLHNNISRGTSFRADNGQIQS